MEATQQKQPLDMLNGPIWNKLPRYALPVAATAVLEQLFNASDLAVVGNFTGEFRTAAVAAVGANSPVIGLIINLFVGIALGANVVIANAIGQQDSRTVHRTVHTAVLMSVIGGILVALLGQLAAGPLLGALNVPEDVLPFALRYLRIYLLGMPAILLYNFEAAIFRSVGDTKVPLQALVVSGILNVLMNLFFVAVLHMTVEGVATATVLANVFSAIILLRRLMISPLDIRVEPKALRIHADCMGRILRIGLPAGIQSAVFSVSNIVIQAGIKKTLALSLLEDAIATAAVIALVLGAGKPVLAIFNNNPQVISLGYTRLVLVFSAYMFSMMYEVMSGYLRGFGISLTPAALTTLGVCGIRIFWIAVVFPRNPTFRTIMYVYPISLSTTALLIFLALLWFRPAKKAAARG